MRSARYRLSCVMRHQTFAHDGRLTDDKHFRGIAVETIFDYGDINVNDIAIFQQLGVVRDTVAHHFINRNANGFRIAVIAEAGRNRVLFINNVIITDAIQLAGADARFNIRFVISSTSAASRQRRAFFRYLLGS